MKLSKLVGKNSILVAVSALSLVAMTPAWAGFAQGNSVTMGGQPVFSIAGSADGFSPDHRAWLSQDALDNALVLSPDKSPSAVAVTRENGACVVTLGGRRVATADANSARLEGMSVEALANKWADGMKNFLSNQQQTMAYVATLTGRNPVNANVAIAERRIYAPPGTVLPVAFQCPISSETLQVGQSIQGTLVKEVAFGNYIIPAGSIVTGTVNEVSPGAYTIGFNTLRLANGTVVPIAAALTGDFAGIGPHLVATEKMPYGDLPRYQGVAETACRIPAQIGIGTMGGRESLVFHRGSNLTIAAGTPVNLVFNTVTPVAVVLRGATL